jgi:hypothetical protein
VPKQGKPTRIAYNVDFNCTKIKNLNVRDKRQNNQRAKQQHPQQHKLMCQTGAILMQCIAQSDMSRNGQIL